MNTRRVLRPLAASLLALLCACSPDAPKPKAKPTPEISTPAAQAQAAVNAQAHAFFKGEGEHWTISLEQAQDGSYPLDLRWDDGAQQAQGRLRRGEAPAGSAPSFSLYEGQVMTEGESQAVKVEISLGSCTDRAENMHTHRVRVLLNEDDEFSGCGGLL